MSPASPSHLIRTLRLQPHPEGGWFRETYRSAGMIPAEALPADFAGPRCFSTAILFLLTADTFSAFHRIRSDELWHFHAGDALEVHALSPEGRHEVLPVGPHAPQAVVPAGCWFGARVAAGGTWSLVGCTVSPGFEFADFALARRADLLSQFPAHRDIILALTRD